MSAILAMYFQFLLHSSQNDNKNNNYFAILVNFVLGLCALTKTCSLVLNF